MGIMNVSGDIMVEYTYDAWGNVLSITGPMADTMGQHNQLRYRGYVYDPETDLYYLNSRFYNPETGRFINADAFASTGGLLGNNMFAYCANEPVKRFDPTGHDYTTISVESDPFNSPWRGQNGGGSSVGFAAIGVKKAVKEIRKVKDYIENDNVATVLEADFIAFYKGALVIKSDLLGTGGASFGVIILGSGNSLTEEGINTLNHEYGHYLHFKELGPVDYLYTTAIFSIAGAILTDKGYFPRKYYFDLPWERVADMYGGVERGYLPGTNESASTFLLITKIIGRITLW